MAETTAQIGGTSNVELFEVLRAHTGDACVPSSESAQELQNSDLVLMSGQFVGAGKSTLIQQLEADGRVNIPSWTNRDLRPGEVEGIDKIQGSVSDMAQRAIQGYFLEMEEVRPEVFYATPSEFTPGKRYVKDLELKGAMRLRTFAPEVPIVVPLPPTSFVPARMITEWERRVIDREGLHRHLPTEAITDLENRLTGVIEEATRVEELDLISDPFTLFVINDHLPSALGTMRRFLSTGEKRNLPGIAFHVEKLKRYAQIALESSMQHERD